MPLPTSSARRWFVALAGLLTAGTLTACGTGLDAQTNEIYNPAIGVNARGGGVDVLNLLIVANPDGTGTVSGALINQSDDPDQLTGVAATNEEAELLRVEAPALPLVIPPADEIPIDPVNLEDGSAIYVPEVRPGSFLTLELTFANGEPVVAEVPVVDRDEPLDIYSSVPTGPGGAEPAPTGEPTEPAATGEPTEPAPTGEPTESAPTAEPTTTEPTEPVPSESPESVPAPSTVPPPTS